MEWLYKLFIKVTLPRILFGIFSGFTIIPVIEILHFLDFKGKHLKPFIEYISITLSIDLMIANLLAIPFLLLYIIGAFMVLTKSELKDQWIGTILYLIFYTLFWVLAFLPSENDCFCPDQGSKWIASSGVPLLFIHKTSDNLYDCFKRPGYHPLLPNIKLRPLTLKEAELFRNSLKANNYSIFNCCKGKNEQLRKSAPIQNPEIPTKRKIIKKISSVIKKGNDENIKYPLIKSKKFVAIDYSNSRYFRSHDEEQIKNYSMAIIVRNILNITSAEGKWLMSFDFVKDDIPKEFEAIDGKGIVRMKGIVYSKAGVSEYIFSYFEGSVYYPIGFKKYDCKITIEPYNLARENTKIKIYKYYEPHDKAK